MKLIKFFALLFIISPAALPAQERIVDNAGLLNTDIKLYLEEQIEEIINTYNFDLVIVTEKNIGKASPMDYADDFFDNNDYGIGEDFDGCLFLHVTDTRDYWFSTCGRGIKILTSSALKRLENEIVPHLKDNNPDKAYMAFINEWKYFLSLEAKGRSYNFFQHWNLVLVITAWIISFLIGLVVVLIWKAKMNTARPKTQADAYIIPDSLSYKIKQDRFLYSTITKSIRQKSSSSSSGSSHTSSSGRSHGGGGGKY